MSTRFSQWMFDIEEAPVEVPLEVNGQTHRVKVPTKKALVAVDTGKVVGIVSKGYQVVTNTAAVQLCQRLCGKVFPSTKALEWELGDAKGTRARTRVSLDLKHRAHVMNLWDLPGDVKEAYTPFVRVTNSYNGLRALRFDVGFMRSHCSNGVVFEEDVVTIKAAHTKDAIAGLNFDGLRANFTDLEQRFRETLERVRAFPMTPKQGIEVVKIVTGWPSPSNDMTSRRADELKALDEDLNTRNDAYFEELGENSYAAFNVMTDIATRPPVSFLIRRDSPMLQRRAGRWLKSTQTLDPGVGTERLLRISRELFN